MMGRHLLALEESIEDKTRIRQLIRWKGVLLLNAASVRRVRLAHFGDVDVVVRAIRLPNVVERT